MYAFSVPPVSLLENAPPSPKITLVGALRLRTNSNMSSFLRNSGITSPDAFFNFTALDGRPSPGKFRFDDTKEAFLHVVSMLYHYKSVCFLTQLFDPENLPFMFDVDIKQKYGFNYTFIACEEDKLSTKCVLYFLLNQLTKILKAVDMPIEAAKCVVWSAHGKIGTVYKTSYRVIFYNLFLSSLVADNLYSELIRIFEDEGALSGHFDAREMLDKNIYRGSGSRVPFSDKPPIKIRCDLCSNPTASSKPLRPGGRCPYGKSKDECKDVKQNRIFTPFMAIDVSIPGYIDRSPIPIEQFVWQSSARLLHGVRVSSLTPLFKQKFENDIERPVKKRRTTRTGATFRSPNKLDGFLSRIFGEQVSFGNVVVSEDKSFFEAHTMPGRAICPFKSKPHKRSRLKLKVQNGVARISCYMIQCKEKNNHYKEVPLSEEELDVCNTFLSS